MCLMSPSPLPERRVTITDWLNSPSREALRLQESAVAGCAPSLGHSLASPASTFRAQVLALTRGGAPGR